MSLLPCPFCNASAETDLARGFIDYKRQPANAVAIYCTECEADMSLCYGDFPGDTPEHLMTILTERWNKRDRLDECLQQDRLKTREINTLVPENRSLIDRNAKLTAACELALLFHSGTWDLQKSLAWSNGMGQLLQSDTGSVPKDFSEATTKNLCNAVRAALGRTP